MLFKIEAAVRLGYTTVACTSKPCEWNNFFTEKVELAPILEIKFYKEETLEKIKERNEGCQRKENNVPLPTANEQQQFLATLLNASGPATSVGLGSLKETCKTFVPEEPAKSSVQLPTPLRCFYDAENTTFEGQVLDQKISQLKESAKFNECQTNYL